MAANLDAATKARLNMLWTELAKLVERADNEDDSDAEEGDDGEEDLDLNEEIVACCDKIISVLPGDADALRAKSVALIADGDFEAVEAATRSVSETGKVSLERGYALWRMGRSAEALKELRFAPSAGSLEVLQLKAQVQYQMGDYEEAAETYEQAFAILDARTGDGEDDEDDGFDEDDIMELCTNLAAAYVNADLPRRALAIIESRFPKSHLYELLFNRACALIACGEFAEARLGLSRAETAARQFMEEDGLSPEKIESGCTIIRTTSAYVDQLCGNEEAAKSVYNSVVNSMPESHHAAAVAGNNIVSLRGGASRDLFDSWKRIRSVDKVKNLTARQRKAVGLNKLSLLVLTGKEKQVRDQVAEIRKDLASSGGSKHGASSTIEEEDLLLIEAGMLVHKKKNEEATKLLQSSDLNGSKRRVRITLAQFAARDGDFEGAAEILKSTDGVHGTPAGTATVAALYERAGKSDEATKLIRAALNEVKSASSGGSETKANNSDKYNATVLSAVAAMQMRQKDFEAAAKTYGEIIAQSKDENARVAARANLVLACLQFDPERAAKEAKSLPQPGGLDTVASAEELERRELRLSGVSSSYSASDTRRSNSVATVGDDEDMQQEKENAMRKSLLAARRRRIMKRRKKRREAYLAALRTLPEYAGDPETGRPPRDLPPPDPERWVPKRLRARKKTRRRAREKAMAGGHQGGVVSKEDLERFDAAAKAKREREEAEAAAANATNKGKTKGKKKKGKKGRRR